MLYLYFVGKTGAFWVPGTGIIFTTDSQQWIQCRELQLPQLPIVNERHHKPRAVQPQGLFADWKGYMSCNVYLINCDKLHQRCSYSILRNCFWHIDPLHVFITSLWKQDMPESAFFVLHTFCYAFEKHAGIHAWTCYRIPQV